MTSKKKWICVGMMFTVILAFGSGALFSQLSKESSENSSESSTRSSSKGSSDNSSEGSSVTTSAGSGEEGRDREKQELAAIFNELAIAQGERPNLERLSRRYHLTIEDVQAVISRLTAEGEIDTEKSLKTNDSAAAALTRIHDELNRVSKEKKSSKSIDSRKD